jgi:hypothetical protein
MSLSSRKPRVMLSSGAAAAVRSALVLGAAASNAANWEYQPRIELGATYNDNYRLAALPADKIQVWGAELDAQLSARLNDPRWDVAFTPRLHTTYYPHHPEEQSTDGFFNFTGNYRTQKSALGGQAEYSDESVVFSELLAPTFPGVTLGQLVAGESANISFRNRRKLVRLAPKWTYDLSPRRRLHLDAEYLDASYSHNLVLQQVGFRNVAGTVGVEFQVTPLSSLTVRGVGSRFEPKVGSGNTNRYGFEAEWGTRRSEVMRYYFRLGANRADGQAGAISTSTTGAVGGAGIRWAYQTTEIVVDALRGFEPSSVGAVTTRDELRFRMTRALRPRLQGFVGARGVHMSGATQQVIAVQSRSYVTATAGLEWRASLNYRIAGTYDYEWVRFEGQPTASSNAVTLSLVYQPQSRYEPIASPIINPGRRPPVSD